MAIEEVACIVEWFALSIVVGNDVYIMLFHECSDDGVFLNVKKGFFAVDVE